MSETGMLHHQRLRSSLYRLGKGLCESELRVKSPGGEAAVIMKLPRIGHPLVN